jgi:hypothetical protein
MHGRTVIIASTMPVFNSIFTIDYAILIGKTHNERKVFFWTSEIRKKFFERL